MRSNGPAGRPVRQLDRLDYIGYERYGPPLFGYILRIIGSVADAEDIVQECFVRALASLDTEGVREEVYYRRWLYHVATNLCRDALRRRSRALRRAMPLDVSPAHAYGDGMDGMQDEVEAEPIDPAASFPSRLAQQQLIEQAFARMEPQDVGALLLTDHFGFSLHEVAEMLECSYAAGAKRVGRARERFARHYRELGKEEVGR